MKRLVLVRHGESLWNAEGRIQGQRCAGLSEIGHAQAEVTANALADSYPDALLVASDLQRTMETALPLSKALGREIVQDSRLRERSFGTWEGRLRHDVVAGDAARWERFLTGEDAVVEEVGGETAAQLGDRVEPLLRDLLRSTADGQVTIAVTHGGPVWHGTHRLLGLRIPTLGGVGNACVTEFIAAADGDRLVLDRWNQVSHLPRDLRTTWRPGGGDV
jgi:glucosyl-3-phosphoglycerate phosphatase